MRGTGYILILDVVGQVEDYTEEAAWKEKG